MSGGPALTTAVVVFWIFLNRVLVFLSLACNIYAGEKHLSCYYGLYLVYLIAYLIILELATIDPLG